MIFQPNGVTAYWSILSADPAGTAPTGGTFLSPDLLDAYISYKAFDFLKITAGQFLIPFSQESLTPDRGLETIDRSQVVSALVARKGDISNKLIDSIGNQVGRDIGLMVNGSLIKMDNRYFVDYYLALVNGAGINTLDNNPFKDIGGRLVFHPFKILDLGVSYYNGFDMFTSSPGINQERVRLGTEFALNYNLLSVKGNGYREKRAIPIPSFTRDGTCKAVIFSGPNTCREYSGMMYMIRMKPNRKNLETSTYYVFGLNYFFNVWTKIQMEYSWRTENPTVHNNAFAVQLQLGF